MLAEKWKNRVASVLGSYAKRFAEKRYDQLSQTEPMESLKELSRGDKLGLEGALYGLTAMFDEFFKDTTPTRKFLKEVLSDSGSEISKRLLNGTPEQQASGQALLAMNAQDLDVLIEWLQATPIPERSALFERLKKMKPEERANLLKMDTEKRQLLATLLWGKPQEKESALESATQKLQAYIDRRKAEKGRKS